MNTTQLRQKILDLAIRGKLVPQDPNDEPASVLLERIRIEKEHLIKEGKIRRNKTDDKRSTTDKSHYEQLPQGWVRCRMRDISEVGSSKRVFKSELVESGVPFYRGTEIGALAENKSINRSLYITLKHYQELISDSGHPSVGDILMPSICPDGRIWLVDTKEPFYFKDGRVLWIHFDSNEFNKKYVHLALKAMLVKTFSDVASGSTFAELKIFILKNVEIPLPPLSEQCRIVSAVESAFAVIDEIERNKADLQVTIAVAKQKVLSLAIQGKLVPQDPNDEPASVLLERIRKEREILVKVGKIKHSKTDSTIKKCDDNSYYEWSTDATSKRIGDEIPFILPDSWSWCWLGSICDYGFCNSVNADNISDDAWILDLEDIEKDTAKVLHIVRKRDRSFSSTKHSFSKGQVLYGKLRPYLNKVVVAPEDGYCTTEILPLSFKIDICPEYVRLFLMSNHFLAYANLCSYGVKMPRLGTNDGKKALFALPPLAEQRRIVAVLEAMFNRLDYIGVALSDGRF